MVGLEAIVKHYGEKLDGAVAIVETGKRYLFDSHALYSEWVVQDSDFNERFNAAFSLLYDVAKKAKNENESLIPTIAERARTPVIDDVLTFIDGTDNFDEAKDQFVEQLSQKYMPKGPQGMDMTLLFPLRAALFLETMQRHPEKAKIATITTSYFPHKLFGDLKAEKSQWYIVKEAETEIATVLPTLYSERLQAVVPRIDEFVERGSYGGTRGSKEGSRRGKYSAVQGFRFRGSVTETEFDELFGSLETKKEIMYTLAQCMKLTSQEARKRGGKATQLPRFRLPATHYGVAMNTLRAYARNQMLYVFKETGGKAFTETPLTKMMGLRGEISGDNLVVNDDYTRCTERMTIQSQFVNTSANLPLCIALLDGFYKAAETINSSRQ